MYDITVVAYENGKKRNEKAENIMFRDKYGTPLSVTQSDKHNKISFVT